MSEKIQNINFVEPEAAQLSDIIKYINHSEDNFVNSICLFYLNKMKTLKYSEDDISYKEFDLNNFFKSYIIPHIFNRLKDLTYIEDQYNQYSSELYKKSRTGEFTTIYIKNILSNYPDNLNHYYHRIGKKIFEWFLAIFEDFLDEKYKNDFNLIDSLYKEDNNIINILNAYFINLYNIINSSILELGYIPNNNDSFNKLITIIFKDSLFNTGLNKIVNISQKIFIKYKKTVDVELTNSLPESITNNLFTESPNTIFEILNKEYFIFNRKHALFIFLPNNVISIFDSINIFAKNLNIDKVNLIKSDELDNAYNYFLQNYDNFMHPTFITTLQDFSKRDSLISKVLFSLISYDKVIQIINSKDLNAQILSKKNEDEDKYLRVTENINNIINFSKSKIDFNESWLQDEYISVQSLMKKQEKFFEIQKIKITNSLINLFKNYSNIIPVNLFVNNYYNHIVLPFVSFLQSGTIPEISDGYKLIFSTASKDIKQIGNDYSEYIKVLLFGWLKSLYGGGYRSHYYDINIYFKNYLTLKALNDENLEQLFSDTIIQNIIILCLNPTEQLAPNIKINLDKISYLDELIKFIEENKNYYINLINSTIPPVKSMNLGKKLYPYNFPELFSEYELESEPNLVLADILNTQDINSYTNKNINYQEIEEYIENIKLNINMDFINENKKINKIIKLYEIIDIYSLKGLTPLIIKISKDIYKIINNDHGINFYENSLYEILSNDNSPDLFKKLTFDFVKKLKKEEYNFRNKKTDNMPEILSASIKQTEINDALLEFKMEANLVNDIVAKSNGNVDIITKLIKIYLTNAFCKLAQSGLSDNLEILANGASLFNKPLNQQYAKSIALPDNLFMLTSIIGYGQGQLDQNIVISFINFIKKCIYIKNLTEQRTTPEYLTSLESSEAKLSRNDIFKKTSTEQGWFNDSNGRGRGVPTDETFGMYAYNYSYIYNFINSSNLSSYEKNLSLVLKNNFSLISKNLTKNNYIPNIQPGLFSLRWDDFDTTSSDTKYASIALCIDKDKLLIKNMDEQSYDIFYPLIKDASVASLSMILTKKGLISQNFGKAFDVITREIHNQLKLFGSLEYVNSKLLLSLFNDLIDSIDNKMFENKIILFKELFSLIAFVFNLNKSQYASILNILENKDVIPQNDNFFKYFKESFQQHISGNFLPVDFVKKITSEEFGNINEAIKKIIVLKKIISSYAGVIKFVKYAKQNPKIPEMEELNIAFDISNKNYSFLVLKHLDPRYFSIGSETSCCQVLGGAGEAAAIDSYVNSYAGVLILEVDSSLISQSYFHIVFDKDKKYIFLDNIESSKYEKYKNIAEQLYAAFAKEMIKKGYSGVFCGKEYTKIISEFKLINLLDLFKKDPRHFEVTKISNEWDEKYGIYTDFSLNNCFDLSSPLFTPDNFNLTSVIEKSSEYFNIFGLTKINKIASLIKLLKQNNIESELFTLLEYL